jgi:uncharacterized protein YbjQ (UPF0145 family)
LNHEMTTTAFTIDGYRINKTLGVVRGITVRSRSILGSIGAGGEGTYFGNSVVWRARISAKPNDRNMDLPPV